PAGDLAPAPLDRGSRRRTAGRRAARGGVRRRGHAPPRRGAAGGGAALARPPPADPRRRLMARSASPRGAAPGADTRRAGPAAPVRAADARRAHGIAPSLVLAFFLGGAAALVHEVVWARLLVALVGATAHAQAAVLAVTMGGLAVGATLFGRRADRDPSPLRTY